MYLFCSIKPFSVHHYPPLSSFLSIHFLYFVFSILLLRSLLAEKRCRRISFDKDVHDVKPSWYYCRGPPSEQVNTPLVFYETPDDVRSFFYFENVATRGRSSEDRAVGFAGHLASKAFHFYYEDYAKNADLLDTAEYYSSVKKAIVSHSGKPKTLKEKIQRAFLSTLDPAGFLSSFCGMESLFKKLDLIRMQNTAYFGKLSWNMSSFSSLSLIGTRLVKIL